MKKISIIPIFAALSLCACEKRIDIDAADQQQYVVVKSMNVDGGVSLSLTMSRPIYSSFFVANDEEYFTPVEDAEATLTVGGGPTLTATRMGNFYSFDHTPQPGEALDLTVVANGAKLTSSAVVPYAPRIEDLQVEPSGANIEISFDIADDASTDDYYSLRVYRMDTVVNSYIDSDGNVLGKDTTHLSGYLRFYCVDYLLVSGTNIDDLDLEDPSSISSYTGSEMLFADDRINGQTHRVKLTAYSYDYDYYYDDYQFAAPQPKADINWADVDHVDTEHHRSVTVVCTNFTRDAYFYKQTMRSYSDDFMLTYLSEPVQIHSNINGGIGIFGIGISTSIYIQQ